MYNLICTPNDCNVLSPFGEAIAVSVGSVMTVTNSFYDMYVHDMYTVVKH